MAELSDEYSLVGRTVDINFTTGVDEAREKLVMAIIDGVLVCKSHDDVVEWYPLANILAITERKHLRRDSNPSEYH